MSNVLQQHEATNTKSIDRASLLALKDSSGNVHVVHLKKLSHLSSTAVRDSVGRLIGDELLPKQEFQGMVYSNSNKESFIVEGTSLPIGTKSAPVAAKVAHNNGTFVAEVSDRQFSVPLPRARVESVRIDLGKKLLEITLLEESDSESKPD